MQNHYVPILSNPDHWGAGWVSPEGKFYGCDHEQHDQAAERLLEIYGADEGKNRQTVPYGVHCLEMRGWIRLTNEGRVCVFNGMKDPTEAQYARLVDIALAAFNAECNHFGQLFATELNRFLNPEIPEEIVEPPSPFD